MGRAHESTAGVPEMMFADYLAATRDGKEYFSPTKESPVDKIEVESPIIDGNGKPNFWWRWKTRNGKIFATSETYTRVGTARRMAKKAADKIGARLVDKTR